jgi:hypothetical protein
MNAHVLDASRWPMAMEKVKQDVWVDGQRVMKAKHISLDQ